MQQPETLIATPTGTADARNVTIPSNRDFRNAWDLDGDIIDVDMVRARDIHRDRLRRERAARFDPLDVEASQKMIAGDTQGAQAVETKRQTLRDVTTDARINAVSTPEGLAGLTLDILVTA